MRWMTHKNLSDADLELLAGTDCLINLMRNRLLIKFHGDERPATTSELGLRETNGLYYIRVIQNDEMYREIWFELESDLAMCEEQMTQYKLSLD